MPSHRNPSKSEPRRAGPGGSARVKGIARAAGLLVLGLAWLAPGGFIESSLGAAADTAEKPADWVAAAPGRVEPGGGEIRAGTSIPGRVAEVLVKVNNKVEEDELLIRLEDEEARARLSASEAQAGSARSDRDGQAATSGRDDVRKAEDLVYSAERSVTGARFDLDYALAAKRAGTGNEQTVADARRRMTEARDRFLRERIAFAAAQAKSNLPAPNRAESATSTARAEVAIAQALLDKTRIRAPAAGTVLQLHAVIGDVVAPAPDQPLAVLGDMSLLRVKAEVDEGDVAKIKMGQKAWVQSPSYPDKRFEGKVSRLAPSLAAPRITARGPRRPTDVDVLEVTIDLEGAPSLLPGMRVDSFFRKE